MMLPLDMFAILDLLRKMPSREPYKIVINWSFEGTLSYGTFASALTATSCKNWKKSEIPPLCAIYGQLIGTSSVV